MEDENDLEELKLNKQSSSESTDYIPPDSLPSDDDDEDNFPSRSAHGIKYLSSG